MNIFALDNDPFKAARYHCDKHVVKMILESVQMMCTAVRLTTGEDVGYKATHVNHPCSKWVRKSIWNYYWLGYLVEALNDEYKRRFNHTKNHKSFDVMMDLPLPELPDMGFRTPFALAMPEKFKCDDPVKSYREYYRVDKAGILVYKNTEKPYWLNIDDFIIERN